MISEAIQRTPFHVSQLIDWPHELYPDRLAIQTTTGGVSYRELTVRVFEREQALAQLGVRRFQRWGIVVGDITDFFINFFALVRFGCVVVPLNPSVSLPQLQAEINGIRFAGLIMSSNRDDFELVATGFQVGELTNEVRAIRFTTAGTKDASNYVPIDIDPALIIYTSGSTKNPRGIVLQHHAIMANIWANIKGLGFRDGDKTLLLLPIWHSYALIHQCLCHLALGGTICLAPTPIIAPTIARLIEQFGISTLTVVPAVLRIVNEGMRLSNRSSSHVRLITVGAARPDPKAITECRTFFPNSEIVLTYGLTEAGPRVASKFVNGSEIDPKCVGKLLPNTEVVLRSRGREENELLVRSRSTKRGFADETFVEGTDYLAATSDHGEIRDGELYICGRMGRSINKGGILISLILVENVLKEHPMVQDACVESEPHPFWGEIPVARVLIKPGTVEITAEEISQYCTIKLPPEYRPTKVILCNETIPIAKDTQLTSLFCSKS